jgi:hypothetical protein
LIHPRNDRVEVAATNHVPFAADVQAADKSDQPGFKASFDDRIPFAVGPRRAGFALMIEEPASATVERQARTKPIANAFMLPRQRVIRRTAAQ